MNTSNKFLRGGIFSAMLLLTLSLSGSAISQTWGNFTVKPNREILVFKNTGAATYPIPLTAKIRSDSNGYFKLTGLANSSYIMIDPNGLQIPFYDANTLSLLAPHSAGSSESIVGYDPAHTTGQVINGTIEGRTVIWFGSYVPGACRRSGHPWQQGAFYNFVCPPANYVWANSLPVNPLPIVPKTRAQTAVENAENTPRPKHGGDAETPVLASGNQLHDLDGIAIKPPPAAHDCANVKVIALKGNGANITQNILFNCSFSISNVATGQWAVRAEITDKNSSVVAFSSGGTNIFTIGNSGKMNGKVTFNSLTQTWDLTQTP
jgi:hypothetical protein